MAAKQPIEERRFDIRLIEARLRRGTVTADEYKAYLESLPDDASNAEPSKISFTSGFGEKSRA